MAKSLSKLKPAVWLVMVEVVHSICAANTFKLMKKQQADLYESFTAIIYSCLEPGLLRLRLCSSDGFPTC